MARVKTGHVFEIPVGDGRKGVGQVVATYGQSSYYFAVFDIALPADAQADEVLAGVNAPLLMLGLSPDAKVHAGHWTVIGAAPVDPATPLPVYKVSVGSPHKVQVEDYSGNRRRWATPLEAAALPYRSVVAPVRFERAL